MRGRISQFNGAASSIFSPAQIRQAGTPAQFVQEDGAQWPTDRAGEARDQGDPGDRATRLTAIEPGQCGKGRIIKTHTDADPEHRPGYDEPHDAMGRSEDYQAGSDDQVRDGENGTPAMMVDQPADRGADHCGQQQRSRKQAKKDAARQVQRGGNWCAAGM